MGRRAHLASVSLIVKILSNDLTGLDLKKLKGEESTHRVRIGKIRIKFVSTSVGNTIVDIDIRGDNTY